jgi:hypothetical protein
MQDGSPQLILKRKDMKNYIKIFSMLFALTIILVSCRDDEHELGRKLDKSEIKFEVTQDKNADPGGNTVILKNNTPGTISMWDFGTGRSNRQIDTVRFAFKGEYTIKFSALTAGGVTDLDPVTITVTEDNLMYVNDPLWTYLTGGPGKEKTWVLDYGKHGIFEGPLSFYEPQTTWEQMQDGTAKLGWAPSWSDNQWIIPAADSASRMTFSLKGGPFMKTHKVGEGVDESGTYSFNAKGHTISTSNATILRSPSFIANASNWNTNLVVLSLTENSLQIGVRRTNSEGDYLYVWNFITKEYRDNYVPADQPDPNFDHGNQKDILAVTSSKVWKMDLEVPYNWSDLDGKMLNNWTKRADIMATGWAPYGDGDVSNIDNVSMEFFAGGKVTIKQDNGSSSTGTYTINEATNLITFKDIKPSIAIASWVTATTTDDNQWKIVKVEKDVLNGEVVGIWLGKRDPAKSEYMVFHFVQR